MRVKQNLCGCESVEVGNETKPFPSLRNAPVLSIVELVGNAPSSQLVIDASGFRPSAVFRQRHRNGVRFDDADDFREDGLEVFATVA